MNNFKDSDKKKEEFSKASPRLAKNTLYSLLNSSSLYFYSIITSFFIARMVSREAWGFLIIGISFTSLILLIQSFMPPGLEASLLYYIPQYRALNQMKKLRSFLLNLFYLKLIVTLIFYFIVILLITFLAKIFAFSLGPNVNLMYILSSLIIINGMNSLFISFILGLNMFKTRFYLSLLNYIINIGAIILMFLSFERIRIEIIALINVFSAFIPFIIYFSIFLSKLLIIKPTEEEKLKFKEILQNVLKYGGFTSTQLFFGNFWREFQIQSIAFYESSLWVTGYHISLNYSKAPNLIVSSLDQPLTVSLSTLDYTQEFSQIEKTINIIIHFFLFLLLMVMGILYFFVDIILSLIYGENYLIYSLIIKLNLFTIIFGIINAILIIMLKSSNKVKLIPLTLTLIYSYTIITFLICVFYYGIIGALIGLNICNFISFIISNYLIYRIFKIKLDIRRIFMQGLTFLLSLIIALILGDFVLNKTNNNLLDILNLGYFKNFNVFSLGIFLLSYIFFNFLFKVFSKKDIEYIELIFTKNKKSHYYMIKWLGFIKKFLK